jgi:hypothetical protein
MRKVGTLPEKTPELVFEDFSDFNESKNMLFYGDTGAGKTGLLGQLPHTLYIAPERGTISASRASKRWYRSSPVGTKIQRVLQWQDHPQGKDFLSTFAWVKANPNAFRRIVIDSSTKAQQLAMRAIMEDVYRRNPEKRDVDLPDRPEHQKWQNMWRRFVDDWCELPVDVFWTAQAMRRENEEGEDIVLPYIYGKDYEMSAYTCAQMDVVGYMSVEREDSRLTRRILFEPDPPYWAKDWYGEWGHHVDWATSRGDGVWKQLHTMPGLLAKIDGKQRQEGAVQEDRPRIIPRKRATNRTTNNA